MSGIIDSIRDRVSDDAESASSSDDSGSQSDSTSTESGSSDFDPGAPTQGGDVSDVPSTDNTPNSSADSESSESSTGDSSDGSSSDSGSGTSSGSSSSFDPGSTAPSQGISGGPPDIDDSGGSDGNNQSDRTSSSGSGPDSSSGNNGSSQSGSSGSGSSGSAVQTETQNDILNQPTSSESFVESNGETDSTSGESTPSSEGTGDGSQSGSSSNTGSETGNEPIEFQNTVQFERAVAERISERTGADITRFDVESSLEEQPDGRDISAQLTESGQQKVTEGFEQDTADRLSNQSGADFSEDDVAVETRQQDGETVRVASLTESGREIARTESASAEISDIFASPVTSVAAPTTGQTRPANIQDRSFGSSNGTSGSSSSQSGGSNSTANQNEGNANSTPQQEVISQLEDQTGANLSEDDVNISQSGQTVSGELSDQGEITVARQNAPLQNTPLEGVFESGAEARVRIDQATDPAADAFDDATPDRGSISGDVITTAQQGRNPDQTNALLFEAGVGFRQTVTGESNEQARQEVRERIESFNQNRPATGTGPAVGAGGSVGAARAAGQVGRSGSAAARVGGIVGGALSAAGVSELLDDGNQGEVEITEDVDQSELERPSGESQSELEPTRQQTNELEPTQGQRSEIQVPSQTDSDVRQLQLGQQVLIGEQDGEVSNSGDFEITEDDIASNIGEPDQPSPSTRERQRREDLTPFERQFPTGGSAVVGNQTPTDGAQQRVKDAQQGEVRQSDSRLSGGSQQPSAIAGPDDRLDQAQDAFVGQPADIGFGLDEVATQGSVLSQSTNTRIESGIDVDQNISQSTFIAQAQRLGMQLDQSLDLQQRVQNRTRSRTQTGNPNQNVTAEVNAPATAQAPAQQFRAQSRLRRPRFGGSENSSDGDDDESIEEELFSSGISEAEDVFGFNLSTQG